MNTVAWMIGIAVVVFLLFTAFAYFNQAGMVYYPYATIETNPAQHGMDYENVYLSARDGTRIHGWWVPRKNARGTVLFFHGNAGNISHRIASISLFHQLEQNVFIIDYHGFGLSQGSPSEKATYADAEAAWQYLITQQRIQASSIVFFGRSLGGGVAAWLAARYPPAGLILESTFTDLPELGAYHYPLLPVRLLSRFRYNNLKQLESINIPILIAHSPDDRVVPYEHGQRLFEAARQPKTFLEMTGGHNNGFIVTGEKYENTLQIFLNSTQKQS